MQDKLLDLLLRFTKWAFNRTGLRIEFTVWVDDHDYERKGQTMATTTISDECEFCGVDTNFVNEFESQEHDATCYFPEMELAVWKNA